jgi:ComF family protein
MTFVALRRAGQVVLDLVYPPRCVLCDRQGSFLCDTCLSTLPRAEGARCGTCWLPFRASSQCWSCLERPPALASLRSVFRYEGATRRLVRAFKFEGVSSLAPLLAHELAECYRAQGLIADVVVPVPLSGHRKRERGYNQAELLARETARMLGLPLSVAGLRRKRHSEAQARSSNAEQRHENVAAAFEMGRSEEEVRGQQVLLIDDVATTGATLNACAAVLLSSSAASVSGMTLARED